jgi:hypothetical protein
VRHLPLGFRGRLSQGELRFGDAAEKRGRRWRGDHGEGEKWWRSQGGSSGGGRQRGSRGGLVPTVAVAEAPKVKLGFGVLGDSSAAS